MNNTTENISEFANENQWVEVREYLELIGYRFTERKLVLNPKYLHEINPYEHCETEGTEYCFISPHGKRSEWYDWSCEAEITQEAWFHFLSEQKRNGATN